MYFKCLPDMWGVKESMFIFSSLSDRRPNIGFLTLIKTSFFLVLFLLPILSAGTDKMTPSPEVTRFIEELQSGYGGYGSHELEIKQHIINAVNSGNKAQALIDLQFILTELQEEDSYLDLLNELKELKTLLNEERGNRTINISSRNIGSQGISFDRSVYLSIDYGNNGHDTLNVLGNAASAYAEPRRRFGEVYRIFAVDDLSTSWIGLTPALFPLFPGENKFRIHFGREQYDLTIDANKNFAIIRSYYMTRNSCGDYAKGAKDTFKKETKKISGLKVNYLNKTAKISIPVLRGERGVCFYYLSFGATKYYRIKLLSMPGGAKVYVDGKEYGETPFELLINRSLGMFRVAFKKEGYYDAVYEYRANENHLVFKATLKQIDANKQKAVP